MQPFAQAWILTLVVCDDQAVHGLLTVCGDTTQNEPESYELKGSSSAVFKELGSVLDATMWSFLAIADNTAFFDGVS